MPRSKALSLGRLIRDVRRKIAGRPEIEATLERPLARADQIRSQQQRQRGWKLYSFHAPEVECIGKGKASAPYEFGVKASIVTTNARAPGGQFVLHAKRCQAIPMTEPPPRPRLAEDSAAPLPDRTMLTALDPVRQSKRLVNGRLIWIVANHRRECRVGRVRGIRNGENRRRAYGYQSAMP